MNPRLTVGANPFVDLIGALPLIWDVRLVFENLLFRSDLTHR